MLMQFEAFKVTGNTPIFPVSDFQLGLEYYMDTLEFHLDWKYGDPPIYAGLTFGELEGEDHDHVHIHLSLHENTSKFKTLIYIWISGDIKALFDLYLKKGIVQEGDLQDQEYGLREFKIEDPFGNLIFFAQPLEE